MMEQRGREDLERERGEGVWVRRSETRKGKAEEGKSYGEHERDGGE